MHCSSSEFLDGVKAFVNTLLFEPSASAHETLSLHSCTTPYPHTFLFRKECETVFFKAQHQRRQIYGLGQVTDFMWSDVVQHVGFASP